MIQALERNYNHHFAHETVSWEQFKAIQAGFANVPNIQLIYCEGTLEIIGVGRAHEMYTSLLNSLLSIYFEFNNIEFFPSGAYSQIIPQVTEFQSDRSYCFEIDKDVSESISKLSLKSKIPELL